MPAITTAPAIPPAPIEHNIVPEIQDIDDLLSSDEAIAPAIIEPISLQADAESVANEPALVPVAELEPVIPVPQLAVKAPAADDNTFSFDDLPGHQTSTLHPKVDAALPALELLPREAAAAKSKPSEPLAVAVPAPLANSQATPAIVATAAVAKPPTINNPPTGRIVATGRVTAPGASTRDSVVNLVPVTEDEFRHAITHGKSHLFDKWVGLQSRNRIINAVPVEAELEPLLAGLYAHVKVG